MRRRSIIAPLWALVLLGVPTGARAAEPAPRVDSAAALVLDPDGHERFAKNADAVRAIASLTKLQAALVVRERGLKLERGTRITHADHLVGIGGSRTRIQLRWTYRNRDLLHAMLMSSDNRAVSALGRAVGFDAAGLVRAMNARARRRGLKHTRFGGPAGLSYANVSTAREVARIIRDARRDELLSKVMGTRDYRVMPMRGRLAIQYRNTNPLVRERKSVRIVASKTGYNSRAGYCVATIADLARLGEHTFVVLGSRGKAGRFADLRRMIRWVRVRAQLQARPRTTPVAATRTPRAPADSER